MHVTETESNAIVIQMEQQSKEYNGLAITLIAFICLWAERKL
jgi:hypothetical protein